MEEKDAQPTERTAENLMRIVKKNRFKNLGELHKEWTEAGFKASRATTHRRVQGFGYSCWLGPKSSFCESLFFFFFFSFNILILFHTFSKCALLQSYQFISVYICIYVCVCACARMCGCLFCTPDILESHPLIAAHLFSDQWLICSLYHQKIH